MFTREQMKNFALKYKGASKGSARHKDLVDTFNKVKPNGEVANYRCAWCAITVTALAIKAGFTTKNFPMSYNCGTMIKKAKTLGIWVENDAYKPQIADVIIYSWSDSGKGDLKTGASHTGIVVSVSGNSFEVLEGNKGTTSTCGIRKMKVNGQYIRGFITPKYAEAKPKEKKTYTGEFPNLTVTTKTNNAEKLASSAESISWAKGTNKSKWSYETGSPTSLCKTWMQKLSYKTKIAFSDCGYFMRTCVYKAFGTKVKFLNGTKDALPTSVEGFTLAKKGTSIKTSDLKRGDVIAYKKTASTQHTLMYLGNGLITEAGRGKRFGRIIASTKYTGTKHNVYVWRAKESTKTTTKALVKNDSRTAEVKKLQAFLNWYGNYGLAIDGSFGSKTFEAVKKFQKANGLAVDGLFGTKSFEKAKSIKK